MVRTPDGRIRWIGCEPAVYRADRAGHPEIAEAEADLEQRDDRAPPGEVVLGSTSRGLVGFAPCPVVVLPVSAGEAAARLHR